MLQTLFSNDKVKAKVFFLCFRRNNFTDQEQDLVGAGLMKGYKTLKTSCNFLEFFPIYCDKIFVYDKHPIAGRDTQPFDKINSIVTCK